MPSFDDWYVVVCSNIRFRAIKTAVTFRTDSAYSGLFFHNLSLSKYIYPLYQSAIFSRKALLGTARAHGLGVFVAEAAGACDFLGEYVGELVSSAEGHRRGGTYDALGVIYLATLSQTTIVNATRFGSRTKFINHSSDSPNLQMKLLSICGTIRAALFAARDLRSGEEVFVDYGYALDS